MAAVALAWLTDRPGVTSTILGARTVEQLRANLEAADLHLDLEETAALDVASDLGASDYPYGEMGEQQRSRLLAELLSALRSALLARDAASSLGLCNPSEER